MLEDYFGLAVIILALLVPAVRWLLGELGRSGERMPADIPQERTASTTTAAEASSRDVSEAVATAAAEARAARRDQSTNQGQGYRRPWGDASVEEAVEAPGWQEARSLEEEALRARPPAPMAAPASPEEEGGRPAASERVRRSVTLQEPMAIALPSRPRRVVRPFLRSKQGLRAAVLAQAVLGPPKGLQDPAEEESASWR